MINETTSYQNKRCETSVLKVVQWIVMDDQLPIGSHQVQDIFGWSSRSIVYILLLNLNCFR